MFEQKIFVTRMEVYGKNDENLHPKIWVPRVWFVIFFFLFCFVLLVSTLVLQLYLFKSYDSCEELALEKGCLEAFFDINGGP